MATYGFLTLCGPPHHAEFRVCLSTGIEAASSVLGELLAQKVLFTSVVQTQTLLAVQWTYLATALSTTLLALGIHYLPMPEVTDTDLQTQAEEYGINLSKTVLGRFPLVHVTLAVAVLSMFFRNGGWAGNNTFLDNLISSVASSTSSQPTLPTTDYYMVGNSIYAVSSCIFALLCLIVPSHILLLVAYIGCIVFCALIVGLDLPSVNGTVSLNLVFTDFRVRHISFDFRHRTAWSWPMD